ncbi:MAG: hypothetical protein ACFCU9_12685 [Cyanophyceae cyanobacterium]
MKHSIRIRILAVLIGSLLTGIPQPAWAQADRIPWEWVMDYQENVATVDSDIVLLQDLSGSFSDDLSVLQSIAPDIVAAFPQAYFGVSSFVDKPIEPFGLPDVGDYVYRTDLPVSCDANGFIASINALEIFNGNDTPESQL